MIALRFQMDELPGDIRKKQSSFFLGAEQSGCRRTTSFLPLDVEQVWGRRFFPAGADNGVLTGSDFDIESFVIDASGNIWIGKECGPLILQFSGEGELLQAPIPTPNPVNLNTLNGQDPLVIAHRGASGLLPEHTLEAYRAAIADGADLIEPDLAITTNVADLPQFADRLTVKNLDGLLVDRDRKPGRWGFCLCIVPIYLSKMAL